MVGGGKDREEMSDLISRSSLINKIRGIVPGSQDVDFIIGLIENQPTAFDTEKVVEQLMIIHDEGYCPSEDSLECVLNNSCSDCYREKIADIVKKGGVE